ncbi:MAG TPA: adenylate/guanylate cyclase domain-containing protein [Acidobacteriota bacterium]|nr:adenylate/guanylate cyclase domain-containing protein [Acidobacteriota bacterium]
MHKHNSKEQYEENWYWYLTGENKNGFSPEYERAVKLYRLISSPFPGQPRCFECNRPLSGFGGWLLRTHPSSFSPRLCHTCEQAIREEEAGAEVVVSLLFADVRGSTSLAERYSTTEFKELIKRFYQTTSQVLIAHNAMVNRLMGDQVIGLFAPRFAGSDHAKVAIDVALELLQATGHSEPQGPWIPVGIGIHTGQAYVGAVGTKNGVNEITVLGSAPNLAARLSSQAAEGEILVSEAAASSAGLVLENTERRELALKGIDNPVDTCVLRLGNAKIETT